MGVSSIDPSPTHLNLIDVWNLFKLNDFFSSPKKYFNKWNFVKSIKCDSTWENVFKGERKGMVKWHDRHFGAKWHGGFWAACMSDSTTY